MHPFLDYILKANLLLIFFGLFYLIFLKRETFYQLNRWYFIGSIIVAITAPLITFTKTIWIDPIPVEFYVTDENTNVISEVIKEPSFLETIDLQQTAVYLILFISFILIIRKIYAVAKLYRSIKKLPSLGVSNIKISADNKTVYSFYRWIVVPENFFKWQNHQMILDHERIHLNQKHTFDLILVEIVAAVFWFNPLVKTIQRFINSNLEFIVDEEMIETTESVLYQKNLLQFQTQQVIQFANSYNASEIKNRILQINSKKSTHMKKLKFLLATPALVAFFALFQIETVAQVKETLEVQEFFENDEIEDSFYVLIHSQYDDAYYQRTVKMLRDKYNLDVTIDNLKRNKDGDLTSVRILLPKSTTSNIIGSYKKDEPFSPFNLHVFKTNNGYDIKIVHEGEVGYGEVILDEDEFFVGKQKNNETLSFDVDVLRTNRKVFNEVSGKFPIVVDDKLMSREDLKKFDNTTIKSMNINIDHTGKKTITKLNLSTKELTSDKTYYTLKKDTDSNKEDDKNKKASFTTISINENNIEVDFPDNVIETDNGMFITEEGSIVAHNPTRVQLQGNTSKYIVYIVDNKEMSSNDFRKIDPQNIESISVLKDQKTIEKYGDKAKDGVLVITTKAKKEVSLQQHKDALKARELAMKQRNEVAEKKEIVLQNRKEREKSRQELLKKRNEISEKTQQRRKELEEQRKKLLAKRKETIVVSNKQSDKKLLNDDYKILTDIFKDVNKSVKDIEDENFKITSVKASITREDGTKVELSEVY